MTFFTIYCAFAYGAMFTEILNVITDEETCDAFSYPYSFTYGLLIYFIALILFILAPITFLMLILYNIYKALKGVKNGD